MKYGIKCVITYHYTDFKQTDRGWEAWCGGYDSKNEYGPKIFENINAAYRCLAKDWRSTKTIKYYVEEYAAD